MIFRKFAYVQYVCGHFWCLVSHISIFIIYLPCKKYRSSKSKRITYAKPWDRVLSQWNQIKISDEFSTKNSNKECKNNPHIDSILWDAIFTLQERTATDNSEGTFYWNIVTFDCIFSPLNHALRTSLCLEIETNYNQSTNITKLYSPELKTGTLSKVSNNLNLCTET